MHTPHAASAPSLPNDVTGQIRVLPPAAEMRHHAHSTPHCCIVLQGAFEEMDGERAHELRAGQARLSLAGTSHHLLAGDSGAECLVLEIPEQSIVRSHPVWQRAQPHFFAGATLVPALGTALAATLSASAHRAAEPLVAERLMLHLMARVSRAAEGSPSRRPPDCVRNALAWLQACRGRSVRIERLARDAGVHRVYFARSFRRHVGCSPSAYARLLRLADARALLAQLRGPVARIAMDLGFADHAHLTREFRRCYGVTPARFRRMLDARSGVS